MSKVEEEEESDETDEDAIHVVELLKGLSSDVEEGSSEVASSSQAIASSEIMRYVEVGPSLC